MNPKESYGLITCKSPELCFELWRHLGEQFEHYAFHQSIGNQISVSGLTSYIRLRMIMNYAQGWIAGRLGQ